MSKKLPIEEAFKRKMNDLPTGNEEAAWQKMKELLEEKEERRPFAWINLYTVCGFVAVITIFIVWMNFSQNSNQSKNDKTKDISIEKIAKKNDLKNSQTSVSDNLNKVDNDAKNKKLQQDSAVKDIKAIESDVLENKTGTVNNKQENLANYNKNIKAVKGSNKPVNNVNTNSNNFNNELNVQHQNEILQTINNKLNSTQLADSISLKDSLYEKISSSNVNNQLKSVDSVLNKTQAKIIFKPKKQFSIEAGLQLRQQIPLAGQQFIGYNYKGNKTIVWDYMPSVFIKLQKDNRWFFKGEFNYSAPFIVSNFMYSQKTFIDYQTGTTSIVKNNLQKIYYSQVPVSFNYYVKPLWSVGLGLNYNWFLGAVSKQQTTLSYFKEGNQTVSTQNIYFKNFTDSFLYKSTAGMFLQTGCSLKRWSFSAQYAKDLQPFLKYTTTSGSIVTKRNSALNLMVGYSFLQRPVHKKKLNK